MPRRACPAGTDHGPGCRRAGRKIAPEGMRGADTEPGIARFRPGPDPGHYAACCEIRGRRPAFRTSGEHATVPGPRDRLAGPVPLIEDECHIHIGSPSGWARVIMARDGRRGSEGKLRPGPHRDLTGMDREPARRWGSRRDHPGKRMAYRRRQRISSRPGQSSKKFPFTSTIIIPRRPPLRE